METAFDIKALAEKLKSKGLDVAEDGVKILEESLVEWINESVLITPSKIDDIAIPVLMALKPLLDQQIDKIDGKVG